MNLFSWMAICHCFGDFLLQTEYEAINKKDGRRLNRALMTHCLKYTACFVPVVLCYRLHWWWLATIFVGHTVIDCSGFVRWWRRRVCRNSPASIQETPWLTIVHDQIWHLSMLAAVAVLAS